MTTVPFRAQWPSKEYICTGRATSDFYGTLENVVRVVLYRRPTAVVVMVTSDDERRSASDDA